MSRLLDAPAAPPAHTTRSLPVVIVAFALCLASWAGFAALHTVVTSSTPDRPEILAVFGLVQAAVISAGAVFIVRALPAVLCRILVISGVVLALGSAAFTLLSLLPDAMDEMAAGVIIVLQILPALGVLLWAPLLCCAVVAVALRPRPVEDRRRWGALASAAVLLGSVAVCTYLTRFPGDADESWTGASFRLTVVAIIGATAAVVLLRQMIPAFRSPLGPWLMAAVVLMVALSGHLIASLSAVHTVSVDALGIGGLLLWILLTVLFPMLGGVLLLGMGAVGVASLRTRG